MTRSASVLLLGLLLMPGFAGAGAPTIDVTAPWLRATPKGASVIGGYAVITNKGTEPDRLLGASLPMAPVGQVHEMSMANGVMHMRRLDKGVEIKPGATLRLSPGGYHLMFAQPRAPLKEGESVKGTLHFAKAGEIQVTFPVAAFGAMSAPERAAPDPAATHPPMDDMPGMDMGGMDMKGMDMKGK